MIKPIVRWQIINPELNITKVPVRATPGSAGIDFACIGPFCVRPGETVKVPTGLKVAIPRGYCMLLLPRSGLAANFQLTLMNSPGLIDSDYRGEIIALVTNHGSTEIPFKKGDRVCQAVILEEFTSHFDFVVVDSLEETERGEGGLGSTGVGSLDKAA